MPGGDDVIVLIDVLCRKCLHRDHLLVGEVPVGPVVCKGCGSEMGQILGKEFIAYGTFCAVFGVKWRDDA